jgi:membrane peptidoglycan carboxypeptidase
MSQSGQGGYGGSGPTTGGGGGGNGGGGATGVFPPIGGYQPTGSAPATRGYAPQPIPGRGRRQPPPPRKRFIDYPRGGRRGFTRWIPSWKLVGAIITTGFIFVILLVVYAYGAITIPSPNQQALAQTTIIYYGDSKSEIARLATQNRESVQLAQIPLPVREAVLSAEDHTFYTNRGVDPKSIARAAWSNVRGNQLQGGSTISQQYVKNVYDQRDRSFKRKFTEVFLAVKINQQIDKDQILQRYLNTIYLGRGAYGIQAAAHAYFGPNTDVSKLTVSQGAFLAGIINAPSLSDPRDGIKEKARAERRWGVVLDAMVKYKTLTPEERATQKFPTTIVPASQTSVKGQNAYLKEMVEDEVSQKLGISRDKIETGGYKIVTTFNKTLVDAGVKAVKEEIPSKHPAGLRIGMASIDPTTGAVRAIYGGTDITKQLNQATKDEAQGGSTFKAFGLIAALESGVSLKNTYSSDSPMKFKGVSDEINNFGDESFGQINLVKATEQSVNTVFVQLNHDIGPPKTQAAAYAAGIPKQGTDLQGNLVNILGSASVHPIDLASAYGTFAAGGIRHTPYSVQSVSEIGTNKVLWKAPASKGTRVFDAGPVKDLTYALQQVVQHGTATVVKQLHRPVAGKTGTSTGSKAASFVGFTPQLVTAVAMHQVGGKNGTSIEEIKGFGGVGNVTGGTFPARIWTDYMSVALDGKPIMQFPDPVYGGEVTNTPPPATVAPTEQATQQPTQQPTHSPRPSSTPTTTPSVEPSDTPRPTHTHKFPTPTVTNGTGNDGQ